MMDKHLSALSVAERIAFHGNALAAALESAEVVGAADPMSEEWKGLRWLWLRNLRRDDSISTTARLVGHSIALRFADGLDSDCRPGQQAIAVDCGLTIRTVSRCVTELVKAGWLLGLGGNAPGVPAGYQCTFPTQKPTQAMPDSLMHGRVVWGAKVT